jgi:hypothetical protein
MSTRKRNQVFTIDKSIEQPTPTKEETWLSKFHSYHVKNKDKWKSVSLELKLFRGISVLLWGICAIIDTIAYSKELKWLPAKIVFGINAPLYDIFTIIYASGSATFGFSYEIYPLILLALINFILAFCNCDTKQTIRAGFWIFKTVCLIIATELCYYNFKQLDDYKDKFSKATKHMLRYAIIFTVTMIFLMAPGLRAVYESTTGECLYKTDLCNVIELYEPLFNRTDSCEGSYTQYIVGREQLRILRNFLLINIASYAIYDKSFLAFDWKWSQDRFHYVMHLLLFFMFVLMSVSVVIANMIPFDFPELKIKLIFDGAEFAIFFIVMLLLSVNLSTKGRVNPPPRGMCTTPIITDFS